jgi:hypothetical protein
MTRSDEPLFDPRIADWLEDDPYAAPDQALDIVLAAFPSIKQRRAVRVPWRIPGMNAPLRLGLTAAAVGAVAIGSLLVLSRGSSGPGSFGGSTPSATAAPSSSSSNASPTTDPLDTATWAQFVSSRYGFSIAYPSDWVGEPATHDWKFPTDAIDYLAGGSDHFELKIPGQGIGVNAWSVAVAPGTSLDAWIQAYCVATGPPPDGPCTALGDQTFPATMDGHPGSLVIFDTPQAFFLVDDRIYAVACWRSEDDPTVAKYSGARRLLETYLSTMRLLPAGPASASSSPAPS